MMSHLRSNPWLQLRRTPPYCLEEDSDLLSRFNARVGPKYQVDLGLLPDPYIGRLSAPVVLLALNPGLGPRDHHNHAQPHFRDCWLKNLSQVPQECPFYYLDRNLVSEGRAYWESKLKLLLSECGHSAVANHVCCLQYFPYHSREFSQRIGSLPPQRFVFDQLRRAIARRATIVVMRSIRLWKAAVPELEGYDNWIALNNPRNPCVTPRNTNGHFARIAAALHDCAGDSSKH